MAKKSRKKASKSKSSSSSSGPKACIAIIVAVLIMALALFILITGIVGQVKGNLTMSVVVTEYAVGLLLLKVAMVIRAGCLKGKLMVALDR